MSGDLEDFLRRAAERRRAKAGSAAPNPPRRPRPEYTDSRRERVTEPIEVAEIVDDPIEVGSGDDVGRTLAAQRKRIREAEQRAAKIRAQTKKALSGIKPASRGSQPPPAIAVPTSADDLIQLLTQPGGLGQAILIKEILERPEHRW